MRDEGIVQPVSKEMDTLSRRLHQMWVIPGEIRGIPSRSLRHIDDSGLRELLQSFLTHLGTEAGLLRAAKRDIRWQFQMLVDPYRARRHALRHRVGTV